MYTKILNYLVKNVDKALHFLAGMMICLITSIFLTEWISFVLVCFAGLAKEIRDQIVYNGFDKYDLIVTVSGGAFVWFCLYFKFQ